MSVEIIDTSSGKKAHVDSNNNLNVVMPITEAQGGFASLTSEVDSGTITASRRNRALEASEDYRLRVGSDTLMLYENFEGSAINSGIFFTPVVTHTTSLSAGFFNLNAAASTANGSAYIRSYRCFPLYGEMPTYIEGVIQFTVTPVSNNQVEWGFGYAAGSAAATEGVFFRINTSQELRCVINSNGTETQSAALSFATLLSTSVSHHWIIAVHNNRADFWLDNILIATIARPTGQANVTNTYEQPIFAREFNSGAVSVGQTVKLGSLAVSQGDQSTNKPWPHIMAGMEGHSSTGQTGATMGSTAQHANSADPAAANPTNTTAALGTGLGGIFLCNAQATAATDYIIASFQVPTGSPILPGKSLYVTGVRVHPVNMGSIVAGTPTTIAWFVAYGHINVSLASTESPTAFGKSPRRIPLGVTYFPVGGPIGSDPTNGGLIVPFNTPIMIGTAGFFQVCCRFILGTATALQVINCYIGIDGYFE